MREVAIEMHSALEAAFHRPIGTDPVPGTGQGR
jgi:hypothetical protein